MCAIFYTGSAKWTDFYLHAPTLFGRELIRREAIGLWLRSSQSDPSGPRGTRQGNSDANGQAVENK